MNTEIKKTSNESEEVYKAQSNVVVVMKRLFKNKVAVFGLIVLIFLVFMLAQQVYGWIGTIFTEIKYR